MRCVSGMCCQQNYCFPLENIWHARLSCAMRSIFLAHRSLMSNLAQAANQIKTESLSLHDFLPVLMAVEVDAGEHNSQHSTGNRYWSSPNSLKPP